MEEKKPLDAATRAAQRIYAQYEQHLDFWAEHEELSIEDIACIIDEELERDELVRGLLRNQAK